MTYRSDLERMTTVSAQDIDDACRGVRLSALIDQCVDEILEFTALADEAAHDGRTEEYLLLAQEVSAWRDTVQVLRSMAADESLRTGARRGAA